MRLLVVIAFFLTLGNTHAQHKYKTTEGEIRFNASTPLEDIHASNVKVNAIINTEKAEFAAVLLIKDFKFKRKLMQEHFNENYMESEKYPKAYFIGSFKQLDIHELTTTPEVYTLDGKFAIHGVVQSVTQDVMLSLNDEGHIVLTGSFILKPADFHIKIPKIVFKKIAQEVEVEVSLLLKNKAA